MEDINLDELNEEFGSDFGNSTEHGYSEMIQVQKTKDYQEVKDIEKLSLTVQTVRCCLCGS